MADKGGQPSGGHGYDPRRLYPFGLSPIPELPSGLASEVSSVCSYSPTPSDDFADDSETDEEVRSRSIMYSGSCSSVKEQQQATAVAAAAKVATGPASSDSDDSSTERDTSDDSEDDSDTDVETEDEYTDEEDHHKNLYSSQVETRLLSSKFVFKVMYGCMDNLGDDGDPPENLPSS